MKTSDSSLRDLYQRATAGREIEGCPSAEELSALAVGEVDEAMRARLAEHVAECSDCALELSVARELSVGEADVAPFRPTAAASRRSPGARRSATLWIAAALALFTVGGVAYWQALTSDGAGTRHTLRTDGLDQAAVAPAPGATVGSAPSRLEWPAQTGATGYRVVLLDATGSEVWTGSVEASGDGNPPARQIDLPGSAFTGTAEGPFLWLVEVQGLAQRSRLGPFRFRIEAAAEPREGP